MEINIQKIEFKITPKDSLESPDLLAYVSLVFKDNHERHFTSNGFTIRKSKHNDSPYLTFPSKRTPSGFYKFSLIEKSLFKEIEKEVIRQYECDTIQINNAW
jgi:DNA-binding cell septation regulator SpoVG